jgi:hypothetical protein
MFGKRQQNEAGLVLGESYKKIRPENSGPKYVVIGFRITI